MTVLVYNCFNWIGFHLIQALLESGYMVKGADDLKTEKQVHLSMFMGRNADFQLFRPSEISHEQTKHDVSIQVHATGRTEDKRDGFLDVIDLQHEERRAFTIRLPLLFGPWMTMTEEGMSCVNGEWLWFDSISFRQEAFCIEKYMGLLVHWLKNRQLATQYHGLGQDNDPVIDSKYIQTDKVMYNDLQKTRTHFLNNRSFY